MENRINIEEFKVLFVSSSGKVFKFIPFIKSQYESLQPFVRKIDHYRIKGSGIKAYILAYKELKKILKSEKYDIIHAHWTYSGIICSSLIKKEKLVVSFMGNDLFGIYTKKYNILTFKGLINILLSQYLLFKTDAIIVKSKRMLRWIPFYCRYKTQIVPNGVNLNKFKPLDQNEAKKYLQIEPQQKYILFLGDTKDSNKNFDLLEKAGLQLDKAEVSYKILKPYPIDRTKVPFYLAAADVLAFTSKLEGSPNIIKEAIAMGCPIVATDVGDVFERISGIDGCYISKFDEYDFSEKLAAALKSNKRINPNGHLNEISEINISRKIISLYVKMIKKSLA